MQVPTPQDKLAEFDARLSRIEGIVEQISTRLTSLENRVEQIQQAARTDFRWLVGIQVTTIVTLGMLILVKLG
ncbi:MAG: hypothetical protein F4Y79_15790 [Gemmatimonadetes bacterium]|nr:hypothetical protein [Gemmatimonadota bacterium]MXZ10890.1 hypothetical protein [Gemmatimonadota bacterium]MYC16981.1 hypothetical protein [Gemmatimonadota bacterium]MYD62019.1 hypothetical protein [Gemmatimonadota bacterium]MYK53319.1 hypothetical protein [Gemmatimonadota bacterium]